MTVVSMDKLELLRLTRLAAEQATTLPDSFATIGNRDLLIAPKTALLCSRSCPGEIILQIYDVARRLRDSDLTFIGGFHTPVERDFLHHLWPGNCKLIICLARSLEKMRLPTAWQSAIEAERLLLISPFTINSYRRQTARLAERRNNFVIALADQILLLHAAPNSHTAHLSHQAKQQGKQFISIDLDSTQLLK